MKDVAIISLLVSEDALRFHTRVIVDFGVLPARDDGAARGRRMTTAGHVEG